ncbi:MAG TPA: protein phosphatase 2C domain-containing protein [Ktedonobacteraceae bacterium]|nr:protein phosphatase 2C domain-containing protein [Ktedonobacteraceae bacterium]
MIKQIQIACEIHLWVRYLSLVIIGSSVYLLGWISGGFPPKSLLLLLQAMSQFPYLFNMRGLQVVLSLVAVAVLSLTWLALYFALLWAALAVIWLCGHGRLAENDPQFSRTLWQRTRSTHHGGTKRASTQFVNAAEAVSDSPDDARVEKQKAPLYTVTKGRKAKEMDPAFATTENVGIGWDTGIVRRNRPNEDSLAALHITCTHNGRLLPLDLYVVADGMGGHSHGQEAGCLAMQGMLQVVIPKIIGSDLLNDDFLVETLVEGVQLANGTVHDSSQKNGAEMGTTITAALVFDGTAYIVNVGDSRTYIYHEREGQLVQVTRDHSLVARLVEVGAISHDEVYTHPSRNKVYRGLGDKGAVEVDWFTLPVSAGDYLLLCSDGLWEMVRDQEIERIMQKCAGNPPQASATLVKAALKGGGSDNISAIVVRIAR